MAKRRNTDETRNLLLETGAAMLVEHGITVTLATVSMIDACREAGLSTTGSAYKIWPNQEAFRSDLLGRLVDMTAATRLDPDLVATMTRADILPPLDELIRLFTTDPEPLAGGGPGYSVYTTLFIASRPDPDLAERIHTLDLDQITANAQLFDLVARAYGLEFVPPFDAQMLATTFSALAEGFTIRTRTMPEIADITLIEPVGPDTQVVPWTLFGACIATVTHAFLRPGRQPMPPHAIAAAAAALEPDEATDPIDPATAPATGAATRAAAPAPAVPGASPRRPRRRRRSLDETRDAILDAGVDMLVASGFEVTIGRVDLVDVCRRAGLESAGSAYNIWPNQEAYRRDLIRTLLASRLGDHATPADLADAFARAGADLPEFDEVLRTATVRDFEVNTGILNIVNLAVGLAASHDDELAAQLHDYETRSLDEFAALYRTANEAYGLDWVPPFDAHLLAISLSALVQGFAIRMATTPELVPTDLSRPTGPDGVDQPWHLFSCAAKAIIEGFTRPRADPTRAPDAP
ncbi:MAG: TetR family transcriptional regulator C-terminal domain-containing protein [Actinobacteria bacterium]|nr:TetR family transcriptional regulator C-terminal domain-containing protein [Actinomycetota bacterium]